MNKNKKENEKITSYENSPLNPVANKKYVDEIKKSLRMLESHEDSSLFKKLISGG